MKENVSGCFFLNTVYISLFNFRPQLKTCLLFVRLRWLSADCRDVQTI